MSQFKREERYIVVKLKTLTESQQNGLRNLLQMNDIKTVECVVVESDWPNYEQTWRDVEAVANGTFVERKDPVWRPSVGEVCLLDGEEVRVAVIKGERVACEALPDKRRGVASTVSKLQPIIKTNDDLAEVARKAYIAGFQRSNPSYHSGTSNAGCIDFDAGEYAKRIKDGE